MSHYQQWLDELALLEAGVMISSDSLDIPVDQVVTDVPYKVRGNCLALLTKILRNGAVLQSSATAEIYIRFNRPEAPAIPFSLIAASQDLNCYLGTYYVIYVSVVVAGAAGSKLYFVNFLNAGVASLPNVGGLTANTYAAPAGGSSGGGTGGGGAAGSGPSGGGGSSGGGGGMRGL